MNVPVYRRLSNEHFDYDGPDAKHECQYCRTAMCFLDPRFLQCSECGIICDCDNGAVYKLMKATVADARVICCNHFLSVHDPGGCLVAHCNCDMPQFIASESLDDDEPGEPIGDDYWQRVDDALAEVRDT